MSQQPELEEAMAPVPLMFELRFLVFIHTNERCRFSNKFLAIGIAIAFKLERLAIDRNKVPAACGVYV